MKNIFTKVSASLILWGSFTINVQAIENYITVKFRNKVTPDFVAKINKMTNTKIAQKINTNTYKFQILDIPTKDNMDRYSEFFMIMLNVQDVSPMPRIKHEDKINPVLYINIPNQSKNKVTTSVTNQENNIVPTENNQEENLNIQNNDISSSELPNNEFVLKFNKELSQEDIDTLNNSSGAIATFQKDSNSYKITIPETVDPDYVQNFYKNNSMVESFQPFVNEVKPQEEKKEVNNKNTNNNQTILAAIPLNGRDVRINFKMGEEESVKWISQMFGAKLIEKKGFYSFILRFPEYINPKMVARAMKACTSVSSAQVNSD